MFNFILVVFLDTLNKFIFLILQVPDSFNFFLVAKSGLLGTPLCASVLYVAYSFFFDTVQKYIIFTYLIFSNYFILFTISTAAFKFIAIYLIYLQKALIHYVYQLQTRFKYQVLSDQLWTPFINSKLTFYEYKKKLFQICFFFFSTFIFFLQLLKQRPSKKNQPLFTSNRPIKKTRFKKERLRQLRLLRTDNIVLYF